MTEPRQKPPGEAASGADKARLMRLATYASVAVAGALIFAKLAAWLLTGSVAILSTLVDSLLDVVASLINLLAVRHSLQPADSEHRFGHGKVEAVAGLGQAAFVTATAAFLLFKAVDRLITPAALSNEIVGIGVMAFAIVLTLALVRFQRHVVARTKSLAIEGDSLHYKTDVLINCGVMISLALSMVTEATLFDPIFAIAIAGFILRSAWKIAGNALDVLMDRELPDEERARIREIALAHPEVRDMHDLRSRRAGTMTFIQLHLELAAEMDLIHAHEIADAVETKIRETYPDAEVIIHQDPEGIDEARATFA